MCRAAETLLSAVKDAKSKVLQEAGTMPPNVLQTTIEK
jgi:hypothetical protein